MLYFLLYYTQTLKDHGINFMFGSKLQEFINTIKPTTEQWPDAEERISWTLLFVEKNSTKIQQLVYLYYFHLYVVLTYILGSC